MKLRQPVPKTFIKKRRSRVGHREWHRRRARAPSSERERRKREPLGLGFARLDTYTRAANRFASLRAQKVESRRADQKNQTYTHIHARSGLFSQTPPPEPREVSALFFCPFFQPRVSSVILARREDGGGQGGFGGGPPRQGWRGC